MMIHEITVLVGAHKRRKRVGRGRGSGSGKTSGRGHKGAQSRAGHSDKTYFEGGQMSFIRRIPKRGFSNALFREEYHVVNLQSIEKRFEAGERVDAAAMIDRGLIRNDKLPVKILGEGDVTKKLEVVASKFSASARAKIEAAGGSATVAEGRTKWVRDRSVPTKKAARAAAS
jgi:large subunit ribosomal protein L15